MTQSDITQVKQDNMRQHVSNYTLGCSVLLFGFEHVKVDFFKS